MHDGITITSFAWLRRSIAISVLLFLSAGSVRAYDAVPTLTSEQGNISNDGHVKLLWTPAGNEENYVVQQAGHESFENAKIIYEGPDRATFISGLKNGTYYFRVNADQGTWSEMIKVEVKHHSLQLAYLLFGLGGVVFLLTAFVVIKGSLQVANN